MTKLRREPAAFVRCAFFEGRIKPGRETAFKSFVRRRLLPLWRQFPDAQRVEVLFEVEADDGARPFPMVLQIAYPSRAAIKAALASPIRARSKAATEELMAMFEGRIFHVVMRATR